MTAIINRREYLRQPVGRKPVREALDGVLRAMPFGAAGKAMAGAGAGAAIPDSAIYYEGDEFDTETGGWSKVLQEGGGSITFNAEDVFFEVDQANGEKQHIGTADTVDTSFDTCKVEHSSTNFPGFECGVGFDASSGTTRSRNCSTYLDLTTRYSGGASFSRTTDSFDVSGSGSPLYARAGIDGAGAISPGGQWTLHAIYFE